MVEARVAELVAERASRLADIPFDVRLALSLVPVWTTSLGVAAGLKPSQARETFQRLADEGLMRHAGGPPDPYDGLDGDRFWMTASARSALLAEAASSVPLAASVSAVAGQIGKLQAQGVAVPALTRRWGEMAAAPGEQGAAQLLDAEVRRRLAAGESAEALRWVEAGLALEEAVGGELTVAIARASRRIELFHRRAQDKEILQRFLARPELTDAFEALVSGPDELWALHYVGAGGVGKTMTMRHIGAELIPGRHGTSARLDFDYLNPDYPGRAPALLLASLAEELALHDTSGVAERLFTRFGRRRNSLDERLGGTRVSNVLAALGSVEFTAVLDSFADAVATLPKPVVLLLDTCEELAKIRPDGSVPANVAATFAILERLHERLPFLRVVFSGRRPLAARGADWEAPGDRHDERPYLRLHEVRGFTRSEAERFLHERMYTRRELVPAILERSHDAGDPTRFRWRTPAPAESEERYSPFELRLFATWAAEDAAVEPAAILAADTNRYVEMRIVGRINHPELLRLLPAVALLGRFDYETLRAATTIDDESYAVLFEELASQEWIERQPGTFLEVDRGLRPRLIAYCRARQAGELERARRSVTEHLRSLTLTRELRDLDQSHFEACLRLLGVDLPAGTEWWRAVEERFAREEAYDWAGAMLYRVLDQPGGGGEVAERSMHPALVASVHATYTATRAHASAQADLESWWTQVEHGAREHPLADERARLEMRAVAGRLASAAHAGRALDRELLERLIRRAGATALTPQLAGSIVAALEALVEAGEDTPEACAWAPQAAPLFAQLAASAPPPLQAMGRCLQARAVAAGQRPDTVALWEAARLLDGQPTVGQVWLDWRAPDDLVSRLYLEFLRAARGSAAPEQLAAGAAPLRLASANPDGNRLASLALIVQRAVRPLLADELDALTAQVSVPNPATEERLSNAHREVPPLLTVCAEELASQGHVARALDLLGAGVSASESASVSYAAVHGAELAAARIVYRMHLEEEGRRIALAPTDPEAAELAWALAAATGLQAGPIAGAVVRRTQAIGASLGDHATDPTWRHARWRTLPGPDRESAAVAVSWIAGSLPGSAAGPAPRTFAAAACWLDEVEANALAHRFGLPPRFAHDGPRDSWLPVPPSAGGWQDTEAWARLTARAHALGVLDDEQPALWATVGARRRAELELDEAAAVASRVPRAARWLFAEAGAHFSAAGDHAGALLSAIGEAMAAIQVAGPGDVEQATQKARAALGHLALGLPAWEDLEAAAHTGDLAVLDSQSPVEWRPLLARLLVCLTRTTGSQPAREALAAAAPSRFPGAMLPIDGVLAARPSSPLGRLRRNAAARYGGLLWFMLIAAVSIVAGTTRSQKSYGTTEAIGFVLIAATIGLLVWGIQFVRRRWPRHRRTLSITVAPGQRPAVDAPLVSARMSLLVGDETRVPDTPVTTRVTVPYAESSEDVPAAIVSDLRQLIARARRTTALDLRGDPGAMGVAWEALASYAVLSMRRPNDIPFRARRVAAAPPLPAAAGWKALRRAIVFTGSEREALIARRGWTPVPRGCTMTTALLADLHAHASDGVHVVHLVGDAVPTATAVRFELSGLDVESSAVGSVRGVLLRADELPVLFPRAGLYVLQGRPLPVAARTKAEREQAAWLRMFAAELGELGVSAVITVPPLGEDAAADVIARLATMLASPRMHLPGLARRRRLRDRDPTLAFGRAQRHISRRVLKDAADLESAFDIGLVVNLGGRPGVPSA